ncbi:MULTISPECIES: glycoside hydrolase family 16 protein [unclassified Pseudonocardia]|uniref:glycoside hydrolase family 16 protein n=1 Tax=unclassified Pseudonocardia TaxID=2619320 RepID=UPI000A7E0082|nr:MULTISPECIES: glycoside hydrolase family 16 protein [unclassified Pseudonocardia]
MTPLPRRTVVAVVVLGLLALLPAVAGAAPADDCTWRVTAQQLAAALPDQDDPAAQRLLRILRNAGFTGEGPAPGCQPSGGDTGRYVFADEFDGTQVDTALWSIGDRPGDASNNESQCYVPGNVSVADGALQIRSKVDSSCSGYRYTSGMVQWKQFTMLRGTIEIRAKQSGGRGSWPAQWLLGAKCQTAFKGTAENVGGCDWPSPGSDEVDIAEFKSDGPTVDWQNVVSGGSGFKTCKPTVPDASQNWHVYSFTWTDSALNWGIDGKTTCTQQEVVPSTPMFLIINNAMGGAGGAIDDGAFPQTMQIDYVRVSR